MRIFQASTSVGRTVCTTVNTTVNTAQPSCQTWGGTLKQSMRSPRVSPVPTVDSIPQHQTPWGCTLVGNIKRDSRQFNKDNPALSHGFFVSWVVKLKLSRAWNCRMERWHFDPNVKSNPGRLSHFPQNHFDFWLRTLEAARCIAFSRI